MAGSGTNYAMDNLTIQDKLDSYSDIAQTEKLIYITGTPPGIERIRKDDGFTYILDGKEVTDEATLKRIKGLVIPPAWENVWICALPNGHLQATGIDKLKRKQYKYHPQWHEISSLTKYHRLLDFGQSLGAIRSHIKKDLALPGYPKEKVLGAVVSLLEQTHIRIGNSFYEKLYGSFGLTTMKSRHVKLSERKISFSFKGKKGVFHNIALRSIRLAKIIKGCKELPGKDLFQYVDEHGHVHTINSGMVNDYIHTISGNNFSAKDFRTWSGSLIAINELNKIGGFETETQKKHNIVHVIDSVASQLGNTRSVSRKYYIHPAVFRTYEEGNLPSVIKKTERKFDQHASDGLSLEENVLLYILKKDKS